MGENTGLQLNFPKTTKVSGDHDPSLTCPAGSVRRPNIDVEASEIADMTQSLLRVLDDSGAEVGPWAGLLSTEEKIAGLRDMLTVRAFDARMLRAHRQGKTSFYMQSLGEEAVACAQRRAIPSDVMHFPTYRQQGLLISGGYPIAAMMNQVLSNGQDPLKGRQLPVFYSSKEFGFFTVSGNLATQFVQAVGWAMASAISGKSSIASAWIGEGATAESDFFAGILFASTYRVPVILNIVNNQWAISTHQKTPLGPARSFATRGLGFAVPSLRVDGNDYLAVHAVSSWAAERARGNFGPTLIEWVTYRVGAHSTSDDPSVYRDSEEPQRWPLGDPIQRLKSHLIHLGAWSEEDHETAAAEAEAVIGSAYEGAEMHGTLKDNPKLVPRSMFEDVYSDTPLHLQRQLRDSGL